MSFVLEGDIDHFDTKDNEWKPIEKGGAQIIRSGNGISHSERLNAGSHIFQIWFDPNLQKTLEVPAAYDDYKDEDFPIEEKDGMRIKTYKGKNAPIQMESYAVEIKELFLEEGNHELTLAKDMIHSFYLIKGAVSVDGNEIEEHDFFRLEDTKLNIQSNASSQIFMISNPVNLGYTTYYEATRQRI